MNKDRHKVYAFTIMEVMVTMLITALLIGVVYTSYSLILKSHHSFTTKNEDMADLLTLDHLLKKDFDQAEVISKETDGIIITNKERLIHYLLKPDHLIRYAIRTDTFKVAVQDILTSFENVPLEEIQSIEEQNRIDELAFTVSFHGERISYHYHKIYSSENLMQSKQNAVN